ncbi:Polyadenylate-binding protein 4 [Bienertia sinuspersici]
MEANNRMLSVKGPNSTMGEGPFKVVHHEGYERQIYRFGINDLWDNEVFFAMGSKEEREYAVFLEKVKRTLYLDNLSPQVIDAIIKTAFEQYGKFALVELEMKSKQRKF